MGEVGARFGGKREATTQKMSSGKRCPYHDQDIIKQSVKSITLELLLFDPNYARKEPTRAVRAKRLLEMVRAPAPLFEPAGAGVTLAEGLRSPEEADGVFEVTGMVFEATRVVPEREPEMELEVGVLIVNCWDWARMVLRFSESATKLTWKPVPADQPSLGG